MTELMNPEKVARDREFEREALPWIDDVYRFALSLTHDLVDAEDVVQDTFLRAYKSWHTYVPGSDCRRLTESGIPCRPEALANGAMFREASRDNTDELFARLDLGPAIERALARLPEPFQSTVVLVDVEDQPYETAATILGIPVGTVRSRLFRGRRLMQEMLMTHARDAGYAT